MSSNNKKQQEQPQQKSTTTTLGKIITGLALGAGAITVGLGALAVTRYRVAKPTQRLVVTGLGIPTNAPRITSTAIEWPIFRKVRLLDMNPLAIHSSIDVIDQNNLPFHFPFNCIVQPRTDLVSMQAHALSLMDMTPKEKDAFFANYLTGEIRIISGGMTIDHLQSDRDKVRTKLVQGISEMTNKHGFTTITVNIERLSDPKGEEYKKQTFFSDRSIRAASAATAMGRIGTAENEAKATIAENARKEEIWRSNEQLAKVEFEAKKNIAMAQASQAAEVARKTAELQKSVEEQRMLQNVEMERARMLSVVNVQAEVAHAKAMGEAKAIVALADAKLIEAQRQAEATRVDFEARAHGLELLMASAGGSMPDLTNWMHADSGTAHKLIEEAGRAVQGLKPNITISNWNRNNIGTSTEASNINTDTAMSWMGMLPHFLDQIEKSTGFRFMSRSTSSRSTSSPPIAK